jgi:hypothetical protein
VAVQHRRNRSTGITVSQYDDQAEYARRYRAIRPESVERNNAYNRATQKALRSLAKRHPEEYERLLAYHRGRES